MNKKQIIAGSGRLIYSKVSMCLGPIAKYAFRLTGKGRPKFCLIATAMGDDAGYIANFYDACSNENVEASHLRLFSMPNHGDIEQFILSQDVIWVGGGSVVNLLAVWRAHGLDRILKKAWESGVILMGQSAGSICWGAGGTTDSFGKDLRPIQDGLGFLPYSSGVHYDSEEQRRPLFHELVRNKTIPDGYATDDGVVVHFIDTDFHKAVSDMPEKYAYKVSLGPDGSVKEDLIEPELLVG